MYLKDIYNLQRLPSICTRDKIRLAERYALGYVTYYHRLAQLSLMEEEVAQGNADIGQK